MNRDGNDVEGDCDRGEGGDKATKNEDELEEEELKRMEKKMAQNESKEERDYKEEFFELLDEVRKMITFFCLKIYHHSYLLESERNICATFSQF